MGKTQLHSSAVIFFCYIHIILQELSSGIERSSTDAESSALLSLKSSFIDPLDRLHDWRIQDPSSTNHSSHCNWTGVFCNSNGVVEKIDLSAMNLTGIISEEIQNLQNLTSLNLRSNSLSSSLPKSITKLKYLTEVDISQNEFIGALPAGFAMVAGLATLNASGNSFSGIIPEDLENASSLEILDLRGNYFEGTIPNSFKNLQNLRFLGLSGNNLSGRIPSNLGQISRLQSLILGYNSFQGGIPAEIGNLTNLEYLDLAESNLTGGIPIELGKLTQLNTMFLYMNNLKGLIPAEIGNMSSLSVLDLSDNFLSGKIPESVADLKNLQLLNLMCNKLSGWIPSEIDRLPQLRVLELWNNSLIGNLPSELGSNAPLQWLDVSSNSLSGEIPASLCRRGSLTKLIVFNNDFSGRIPERLSTCNSLIRVRIQNNRISGSIPPGFGKLKLLQRLELANNSITGGIPNDLSFSTSLSFIDLSRNQLGSSLPTGIFSIRTLQTFLASNCNLTSSILVDNCDSLSVLDISANQLSGNIPSSIISCEKLVNLNISENRLTGEIPEQIAAMAMLAVIDLSRNFLTGEIPQNLWSSVALETLNLSYNKLEGSVPPNAMLRTIDLAGNTDLCGSIKTLPPCYTKHKGNHETATKSVIAISVILAVFIISFVSCKWYRYRSRNSFEFPWRLIAFQKVDFTSYDVLHCIKESNIIGIGSTGIVYKAELSKLKSVLAVKKLISNRTGNDLVAEAHLLGRLRHRNIVRLLGFVHNNVDTMIVYEFMKNGNLREALQEKFLVDWVSRYNVAMDVAHGLAYLHHDCHPPVIHRDIKSSNILLDESFEARIADFGLARMLAKKDEAVSMVAGSYGYIAPGEYPLSVNQLTLTSSSSSSEHSSSASMAEYGYTLKVDEKSDIYSYGVVLLELLTGKPALDPQFGDIVEWIRRRRRFNLEDVLDRSVVGNCRHVQEEMMLVLRIALICTSKHPRDRPSMRDVITMLGEAKPRRKSNANEEKSISISISSPYQVHRI